MTKAQCRKAQVPPKPAGPEARHHWASCVTRRCRRSRSSENPNGIHKGSGLSKPLRQLPDEVESGQTGADDHQPFGEQHSTCVAVVKGRAAGAGLTVPELVGEKSPPETNRRAEWWLAGRISRSLPTRRGLSALIRLAILFRFGLTRIPFHRKQRRTKNGLSSDGGNLVL